jgi:hypothetical protein
MTPSALAIARRYRVGSEAWREAMAGRVMALLEHRRPLGPVDLAYIDAARYPGQVSLDDAREELRRYGWRP